MLVQSELVTLTSSKNIEKKYEKNIERGAISIAWLEIKYNMM